ncbi:carbon-nitrogen hydrolase family protein [Pelagibacteraceae bacterium]|nr:carbon-nitrogen hydrolase family protein [Pelagibacteraceae bacterium]
MNNLKISQVQFTASQIPNLNSKFLEKNFNKALKSKPHLICTPECSNIITNDKNYLKNNAPYQNTCPVLKMAKNFAKKNKVNINLGSLLLKVKNQSKLVNRSFFIDDHGIIKKTYDKIHMFDVQINNKETHQESSLFQAGNKITYTKINNIKLGMTICYDLRFPALYRKLAKKDCSIVLVPAAFTRPTGKDHWEILNRSRAIENNIFIVATGMCGNHHMQRKTYGHSILVDPWGKIVNSTRNKPSILNSTIKIMEVKKIRKKIPSLQYE